MTDSVIDQPSTELIISPEFFKQYDPVLVLDRAKRSIEKSNAERNLVDFIKLFWDVIEPGRPFVGNWHINLIAEYLEAVADGDIKDLLVNIPPGCAKSLIISVFFPAWLWTRDPAARFLGASYGEELAVRDSTKCRDIITSEKYQEYWPHIRPKSGQDQKLKYTLDTGGWRMATSVGGRATGEHPTFKIVDDPHSALQAASDAERDRANRWFTETLSTRGAALNASTIVVMQRLHQADTAGVILEQLGGYEHLCLPMRYDPDHPYRSDDDPRTRKGELLWPAMFDEGKVAVLEKRLGEYGASGQLQQLPSPPGGGILKTEHFRMWPAEQALPHFQFIVQSYDTAFTEKTTGDPTACSVWGVFEWKSQQCVMLLDCWTEHLSYPRLREKVISEWSALYGGDKKDPLNKPKRADLLLIEEKGSGISLIQDLRRSGIGVRTYNPGRMDKVARAHQFAPMLELDVIYIPESRKEKGQFISWAKPLVDQLEKFPNAIHDDLCLAEGTLITMADHTLRPIEVVQAGDYVLTPEGPRQVTCAAFTGIKKTIRIRVNGNTLEGTPNHPVCLSSGIYVNMDALTQTSEVVCHSRLFYLKAMLRSWCSTVAGIVATPTAPAPHIVGTLAAPADFFIEMSGSSTTEKSHLATTSTTKTGILQTTVSRTLSALRGKSTESIDTQVKLSAQPLKNSVSTWKTSEGLLKSGTALMRGELGTAKTQNVPQHSAKSLGGSARREKSTTKFARGAKLLSWLNPFAQSFAAALARLLNLGSVSKAKVEALTPTGNAVKVFNLTVEGEHCYFANGVLTHNCDTVSQAFIFLRDSKMLELPYAAPIDDEEEIDYYSQRQQAANPYAV